MAEGKADIDPALSAQRDHERVLRNLRLFRRLLDGSNDLIYAIDADTARLLDANDAVARRLGYSRAELLQMTVTEFSVTAAERAWPESVEMARSVGSAVVEGQYRARDGVLHPVEIGLSYIEEDGHSYVIVISRDISERKRQQEHIARLSRLLRMQSAINSAVLRIGDRDELLHEACQIATAIGGYDAAGISIVDPDGRCARPQYHSGHRGGRALPHDVEIGDGTTADSSLTARALRTGQVTISTDLTQPEPPVQSREELYRAGVRTVVSLPLIVEGAMVGALGLSSRNEGPMPDDELLLLQDICMSLSFALRSQRDADTIQYLAYFDPVTGLAKRTLFCQRLESVLARRLGSHELPAVIAFDVEQLSHINERFGGNFGDQLLKEVAARLRTHADGDDCIGYLGGGTFVLVERGPDSRDENVAALVDDALFAKPFSIDGHLVRVTGRIGMGRCANGKEEGRYLLESAEAALQRRKEAGAQYQQYPLDVHSEIANRLALENRLRRALEAGQFELHYRPQLELATGHIRSLEALLRWHDPENGLTLPSLFLPALESAGMMNTVGNWVLQNAVQQCQRLRALGIGPVRIAVNIRALQLQWRTFVGDVIDVLRRWTDRVDGYGIDLQITEATFLYDFDGATRKLCELRERGIRIALDDYGLGHASLGLLPRLPLDLLKIDGTLIGELRENPRSSALVASVIGFAHACGLTTIAKGVRHSGQLEILRGLNCAQWQGNLSGPPLRENELDKALRQSPAAAWRVEVR